MNICVFCGARPNFMKVAPIIRAIEGKQNSGIHYSLVYAGTQSDPTLEPELFDDLQIAPPNTFLGVECENLNELTGQVMSKFELYLQNHPTDTVIVVDDLASTMAAAIVTKKQSITLAHISAGTRSFDINMPKEINRLVIDGLSDILFTAGFSNNSIANKEGAELSKVYMVGNILIDNIRYNKSRREHLSFDVITETKHLNLQARRYIVFTLNRKALLSDKENLTRMLTALISSTGDTIIIAPLRGEAVRTIKSLDIELGDRFKFINPLGYLEFGYITEHALGIVTDSGNVAEEATFNGIPCITLNSYTEHIETVKQGTNVLVGESPEKLASELRKMVSGEWKISSLPDRWDGRSAERIISILIEHHRV